MPTYEYSCEKCGTYELHQRITEAPLTKCPSCGKRTQRLISASSFQLKGGGWYSDLYGSSKSGGSGEKSGGSGGSGGKSAA